jgi:hypothetical protein
MEHVTSLKIPAYDDAHREVWQYGTGSVRKMSLDVNRKLLYVTGKHNSL